MQEAKLRTKIIGFKDIKCIPGYQINRTLWNKKHENDVRKTQTGTENVQVPPMHKSI